MPPAALHQNLPEAVGPGDGSGGEGCSELPRCARPQRHCGRAGLQGHCRVHPGRDHVGLLLHGHVGDSSTHGVGAHEVGDGDRGDVEVGWLADRVVAGCVGVVLYLMDVDAGSCA